MLGVSRPTLTAWIRRDIIDSGKLTTGDTEMTMSERHQWGQVGFVEFTDLINQQQPDTDHDDGRPAIYDTEIEPTPTNSVGIQQAWLGH